MHVLHKIPLNSIRLSKNPLQPIALESLACLHYGYFRISSNLRWHPVSLSFWAPWSNMLWMLAILNQILAFILPAQTSLRTWACSWQIKPWLIVDLYRFNSIIFWLEHLLLIPWFGNHNSFVIKLWNYPDISIIRCLNTISSSGWASILTSNSLWSAICFGGLLSDRSYLFSNPWVLPPIHNAFGKLYPLLFASHALLSSLSYLLLEFVE